MPPALCRTQLGEVQGLLGGFTLGVTHLVFFGAYALALWYGSRRVAAGELDGGRVISIILACVLGGFSLGQVGWGPQRMCRCCGLASCCLQSAVCCCWCCCSPALPSLTKLHLLGSTGAVP